MSLLLKGGLVASGDPPRVFPSDILIEGNVIHQMAGDIAPGPGMDIIDCADTLVTPGFVNGHIHLNQVLNRGLLDELSTEELLSAMHSKHDAKTADDRYWGSLLSIHEGLRCGTTYFAAFATAAGLIGKAMDDAGVRGTLTVAKKDQWWGAGAVPQQDDTAAILDSLARELSRWSSTTVGLSIGAASDRAASPQLLKGLRQMAAEAGCRVFMHVAEGAESVRLSIEHRGRRPVEYLAEIGFLNDALTLVHACHVDGDDIRRIADAGTAICHCPISNAKTAAGTLPLRAIRDAGIPVALGTDCASTGNTNNVLVEGYFGSLIQKALHSVADFPSAADIFGLLTVQGALAVGCQGIIGEVREGFKADLALWDMKQSAFLPHRANPVSTLVYCASEVTTRMVLVDGAVIHDGRPRRFSMDEVASRLVRFGQS